MSSLSSPYVEALKSFYNTVGKNYNKYTAHAHGVNALRLVDAAGSAIKEGSWVLDLATGTGKVAFAAASKVGNTGRILGIDISDEFLGLASQEAKQLGIDDFVEFLHQDVNHLALPAPYTGGQCFDAVTCGSAISMFSSPTVVLDVIASKLLKPGGTLVADIQGPHLPAKLFLDVAVPRGFDAPIDPMWLSDPEEMFRKIFVDSMLELKTVSKSDVTEGKWDASTAEATEKLWKNVAIDSTWLAFGLDKLDPKAISEIKQAWTEKLTDYKDSDGFVIAETRQYLALATSKSE